MKIATLGTGGIGGYLAVRLGQSGHEVACIARGAHLEAIRSNGLTLEGTEGTQTMHPWKATDQTQDVGPVDAIIFGVKGDALEAAAEQCRPMLGDDTVVVPFLNGVEAADRLAAILPAHHVANGVAQVSTTIAAPGVIRQVGLFSSFLFAERDSRPSARISALQAALEYAGVSAPVSDDIDRDLWRKFVLFSAMSGVTATGRCTVGTIRETPALTELFRNVMAETAALARARGVALPADIEETIWANVLNFPPDLRASTAIDLENGRPIEIEWLAGAARRLAAETGVAAPLNAALYALLLPHKAGRG